MRSRGITIGRVIARKWVKRTVTLVPEAMESVRRVYLELAREISRRSGDQRIVKFHRLEDSIYSVLFDYPVLWSLRPIPSCELYDHLYELERVRVSTESYLIFRPLYRRSLYAELLVSNCLTTLSRDSLRHIVECRIF